MPRIGLGLGLRAFTPKGGSYATVPSDTIGAIGDLIYVTGESRYYKKRWVANREGVGDSILFPINLFPSVGDFDFSVRVRVASGTPALYFVNSSPAIGRNVDWQIGSSVVGVNLRDSSGNVQKFFYPPVYPGVGVWGQLRVTRTGTTMSFYKNGTLVQTNDGSGWTPSTTQTGTLALSPLFGNADSIKCCDLRLTGPGGSIIAPLDEGIGTTITNQAGANGTLTDGSPTNFWYASWVPVAVPFNLTAPVVSIVGGILQVTDGAWLDDDDHQYQWYRNGVVITGATGATYDVPATDLCANFSCNVTAVNVAGGTMRASNSVYVGLLDTVDFVPSLAVSLRRLANAYSGPLLRVRRSSDNVEQDFGYDANGKLDTAAILTFCGAGDGLVTTWYSQSGGINAVQTTALVQPSIVLAGVLNVTGSMPMIVGDGVNDIMNLGTGFNADTGLTVNSVARVMVTTGFPRVVSKWNNISVSGDWLLSPATANASRFGVREGTVNKIATITTAALEINNLHIHTGTVDSAFVTSYYDRTHTASIAMLGPVPTSLAAVCLFKDTHPSTAPAKIGISEAIIVQSALTTAQRGKLEDNQWNCMNS